MLLPTPPPWLVAAGGLTIFTLLVFEVLIGYRKIEFREPLHFKIHRTLALTIIGIGVLHGTLALMFLGVIPTGG